MIEIKNLNVEVEGKKILNGLNLVLEKGKVNVLMGPNGSGKSTLANVLMGNLKYKITGGKLTMENEDITKLSSNKRARKGIFLSFQYPYEVEGVSILNFLKTVYNSLNDEKIPIFKFRKILKKKVEVLGLDEEFFNRYLNEGFSGGEKKKSEILQMLVLDPKFVILDETDSGLDIDALKIVSKGINSFINKDKYILLITHYKRILDYITPDKIFIIKEGKIVLEGDKKLVNELEEKGYRWIKKD